MRGPQVILLYFFVVLILGMVIALVVTAQRQQRMQLLERIARRFQGRLEGGDLFSLPRVRLRFQNYPALLTFPHLRKRESYTQFSIAWPDAKLRCEVYPQNVIWGFRRLMGVEDIEIGSPQFDKAYFIAGNNRSAVRELLTASVQAVIFKLGGVQNFGFGSVRDVQIEWAGGRLTVTKPCYLSTYESLEKFVELSAELFLAAIGSQSGGIEFVGEVKEPDAGEAQCQVCGEPLASDLVYCSSCNTPHHRECWEYFGGCSTYACGQKRYTVKAKRKRVVK
jgi:hypothetical protein